MAALEELAGAGNVINHGDDTMPRIELHLTKTLTGHGGLDVAFDQFGGHAEFQGELAVSIDVPLNVVFGIDAGGAFYLETNGTSPEVVFDNIQVNGSLEGEGRLGFLGVTLENGVISVSNVSISVDLTGPGNKLGFSDLTTSGINAASTVTAAGGSVSLSADLAATALLPGMDEPFDLGGATLGITWADVSHPENAVVNISGGVSDLLKARVEELTALLEKLRALTEQLDGTIPPQIQQGLDKVISVVKAFDENVVQALSNSSTEITLQDVVGLMATALHIDLDQFHLAFSGGVLSWQLDLSNAGLGDLEVSSAGFQATLSHLKFGFGIDFGKVVAAVGGGGAFSIADALSLTVSGDIDGLNILDALQGGLQFELGRQMVNVDLNGGLVVDLHGAQLLSFGLNLNEAQATDPETRFLRIGSSDYALTIQDGSVAVVLLSAPTPTAPGATDNRRWVAVEAHGLSGSLVLGTFVSASASGIDISLNTASGAYDPDGTGATLTYATPLNWRTAIDFQTGSVTFGADPVVVAGTTVDLVSNVAVRIAGSLTGIDLGGFVQGAADFEITKSTIDVHVTGTPDVIGATLLTFGLGNLNLSVGQPGGIGFAVNGGSLAIATIAPPAPTGLATDTRRWFAMKGSVGSATFSGIPGLTLADVALRLEINRASGAYDADGPGAGAAVNAVPLNWTTALNLDGDTSFGQAADQLTVGGTPIDFTTGVVRAAGSARVNVFDFVTGRIGFSFSQQLVDVDVNADATFNPEPLPNGTDIRGPPTYPDLNNATLTTLSLSVLADDGNGSNGSEGLSIGVPGGVGLFVASGDLAVAIVTPSAASTGDARSWLALSAHISSASLNGITGLVLGASGLTLEINRGSGVFVPTTGAVVAAEALDWTAAIDLDPEATTFAHDAVSVPVETSTGTVDTPIEFTAARRHVAGTLSLNLANGVFVLKGGFDLTSASLTSSAGGFPLSGADLLALTLTNAAIFVGTGGTLTVGADPADRSLDVVGYGAGAQGFYGAIGSAKLAFVSVGTIGNRYLGLEASGLAADLVGFESILQIGISGGSLAVNRVTTAAGALAPTAPKLNWHALGADAAAAAAGVPAFGAGLTDRTSLHAGGSASFDVASGVLVGKGTVTLDQATISSIAGGVALVDADLFGLTLDGVALFVGAGGTLTRATGPDAGDRSKDVVGVGTVGFSGAVENLKLATIQAGPLGNGYLGLEAGGVSAELIGLAPLVSLGISGGALALNRAETALGLPAAKLDWHALGADAAAQALGVPAFSADVTPQTLLHVQAAASFDFDSFVVGKGTLDLRQGVLTSTAGGVALTNADLFAMTVTGAALFVGIGGTLTRGVDRASDVVGHRADAIGFTAAAAELRIATVRATDFSTYLGVEAGGVSGSLVGVPSVTFAVSDVELQLNQAKSVLGVDVPRLDWSGLAGVGGVPAFTMNAAISLHLAGTVTIAFAGFVTGSAHFDLTFRDVSVEIVGTGVASTLLTFALTNPTLTVGDSAGPHLSVTAGSLALAIIKAKAPTTVGAIDTRVWTSLRASGLTATFGGFTGLDLTLSAFGLDINQADGVYTNGLIHTDAQALDWLNAIDLDGDGFFGEHVANTDDVVTASSRRRTSTWTSTPTASSTLHRSRAGPTSAGRRRSPTSATPRSRR